MVEHAIRVASEAAAERIPALIAGWTREHPALAQPVTAEAMPTGTERIAAGPGADA
jgi:hypothetical protein